MTFLQLKILQNWRTPEGPLLKVQLNYIPPHSALISTECFARVAAIDEESDVERMNDILAKLPQRIFRATFLRPTGQNEIVVSIHTNDFR